MAPLLVSAIPTTRLESSPKFRGKEGAVRRGRVQGGTLQPAFRTTVVPEAVFDFDSDVHVKELSTVYASSLGYSSNLPSLDYSTVLCSHCCASCIYLLYFDNAHLKIAEKVLLQERSDSLASNPYFDSPKQC